MTYLIFKANKHIRKLKYIHLDSNQNKCYVVMLINFAFSHFHGIALWQGNGTVVS